MKAFDCGFLVVEDFEDLVEPRHLEHEFDPREQIDEPELSSLVGYRDEARNQLSQAIAVHIFDTGEIEEKLFFSRS